MVYHMRRIDKEFNDPESFRKVLKRVEYVTLAMVKDGEPYLVSLSHGYDEDRNCIYFHSADQGKKLDFMRANPVIWGQALLDYGYAEGECNHRYVSVMFKGKVKLLTGVKEKRHAFRVMINQLEKDPDSIMDRMLSSEELSSTIVGEISIESVTGKKTPELTV
jgi:nitroimidazol reductase NimA-like FMN-containing flavoprotein (pyridoxamine 5'-phosphate oxidase superfamily)